MGRAVLTVLVLARAWQVLTAVRATATSYGFDTSGPARANRHHQQQGNDPLGHDLGEQISELHTIVAHDAGVWSQTCGVVSGKRANHFALEDVAVVERVVRGAHCSVLVVRPQDVAGK